MSHSREISPAGRGRGSRNQSETGKATDAVEGPHLHTHSGLSPPLRANGPGGYRSRQWNCVSEIWRSPSRSWEILLWSLHQSLCFPNFLYNSMYQLTRLVFRTAKGSIPTPSNHASRRSFNMIADMLNDTLERAPKDYSAAKVNVSLFSIFFTIWKLSLIPCYQALFRDHFRCVITGKYDETSFMKIAEVRNRVIAEDANTVPTQCLHIFSQSTNFNIEPGTEKVCLYSSGRSLITIFSYSETTLLPCRLLWHVSVTWISLKNSTAPAFTIWKILWQ